MESKKDIFFLKVMFSDAKMTYLLKKIISGKVCGEADPASPYFV